MSSRERARIGFLSFFNRRSIFYFQLKDIFKNTQLHLKQAWFTCLGLHAGPSSHVWADTIGAGPNNTLPVDDQLITAGLLDGLWARGK
jgi:hypothetical protein